MQQWRLINNGQSVSIDKFFEMVPGNTTANATSNSNVQQQQQQSQQNATPIVIAPAPAANNIPIIGITNNLQSQSVLIVVSLRRLLLI